jgi:hypothetical protein
MTPSKYICFVLWIGGYQWSTITLADDILGMGKEMIVIGKKS